MPRVSTLRVAIAVLACVAANTGASAQPAKHRARRYTRPAPPSIDAIELAGVAPPTLPSTALQTYGDAPFARAHFQRRQVQRRNAEAQADPVEAVPYPCDPRNAGPDADVCRNDPRRLGYGQGYAFTPSYVSSPQVVGVDPRTQTPVLPGVTGLAWAINSLRFDPH